MDDRLLDLSVGTIDLIGGTIYKAAKFVYHPEYNPKTQRSNLALIKTKSKIKFTKYVNAIPMETWKTFERQKAIAIGFGLTDINGPAPKKLQYINIETAPQTYCYGGSYTYVRFFDICTPSGDSLGLCFGDYGGPLVSDGKLIGIAYPADNCGFLPNVYAKISHYHYWIDKVIAGK